MRVMEAMEHLVFLATAVGFLVLGTIAAIVLYVGGMALWTLRFTPGDWKRYYERRKMLNQTREERDLLIQKHCPD